MSINEDKDSSLESVVAKRLDSIFGDEEPENSGLSRENEPPSLEKMTTLVQGLASGITKEALSDLNEEIRSLEQNLGNDAFFQPLLKISSVLTRYLEGSRETPHPESITLLRSVTRCMRTLDTAEGLTDERKRALVSSEIQSFNRLKKRIQGRGSAPGTQAVRKELEGLKRDLANLTDKAAFLEEILSVVNDRGARLEKDIEALHRGMEAVQETLSRESAWLKENVERFLPAAEQDGGLPAREFYLFRIGGTGYAVDASRVVKSCKAGHSLAKKARKKGGLTLADVKPLFRSVLKGLEPNRPAMNKRDLKRTLFTVVPEGLLEGQAAGGGVLFLACGDSRLLLFSDQLPYKRLLKPDDHGGTVTEQESGESFSMLDPSSLTSSP